MNTKSVLSLLATIFAACLIGTARADVRLPTIFSDHMVLKKSAKVPIWGTADPGEQLTVTLGGQSVQATAGPDGKWNAALDLSHSKPGPFEFSVEGKNKLTVSDVVVGEVWIASGQSNMSWALKDPPAAGEEIAASANPLIRQFLVTRKPSPGRLGDVEGSWTVASPATTGAFSSVGYFFARRLQRELKVPVGFINTSVGGSALEPWLSVEAINSVPDLKSTAESLWNAQRDFPGKRRAFVEAMDLWIKEAGRADKSEANVSAFAGLDASTQGWIPVTLPGPVQAPGLPDAGIVWLRKDIDLSAERARLDNFLRIPLDGFDSVYWNGELIKKTTYQEFPYPGYVRFRAPFVIPPAKQKVGKNVLAIRLYQPVGPAKFTGPVMVGPTNFIGEWLSKIEPLTLSGEWLAKAEFEFPPIEAKNTVATPVLPAINAQQVASIWFNGMVAPLIPYAISGVVWYQGESNADRAWQYRTSFPLLITDWRKQWAQGDFPFYFCQLANFKAKQPEPEESKWAELRAAQSSALTLPKTGQAILIDIGESNDIHPANKKPPSRLPRIMEKRFPSPARSMTPSILKTARPSCDSSRPRADWWRVRFRQLSMWKQKPRQPLRWCATTRAANWKGSPFAARIKNGSGPRRRSRKIESSFGPTKFLHPLPCDMPGRTTPPAISPMEPASPPPRSARMISRQLP